MNKFCNHISKVHEHWGLGFRIRMVEKNNPGSQKPRNESLSKKFDYINIFNLERVCIYKTFGL